MGLTVYGGGGKPEEEKTVTAGTSVIEVLPSSGKTIKKVTVNPTPTESKEVTAGTSDITVSPTDGKHFNGVTVHPTPSQEKTVIPTAGGFKVSPDTGKLLSAVFVDGDSDLVGENIKQGVNIFGVDGSFDNSHGAYVWKKYKTHPDITISMNLPSTAQAVLTVDCDSIDLTKVDVNFFAGYSGFVTVHSYECPFEFLKNGKALYTWDNDVYERNVVYTPSTKTMTIDDNWSGVFTKTFTKEPTLIDYVVADDETAYPDGGEQWGYWYERFGEITPETFGCTKIAIDKFTYTSNTNSNGRRLTHSLGQIPKIVIVKADGLKKSTTGYYSANFGVAITSPSNCPLWSWEYVNKGGVKSVYGSSSAANTAHTPTEVYSAGTVSGNYYEGGIEYTLITMA